jgi:hypothetical protein
MEGKGKKKSVLISVVFFLYVKSGTIIGCIGRGFRGRGDGGRGRDWQGGSDIF